MTSSLRSQSWMIRMTLRLRMSSRCKIFSGASGFEQPRPSGLLSVRMGARIFIRPIRFSGNPIWTLSILWLQRDSKWPFMGRLWNQVFEKGRSRRSSFYAESLVSTRDSFVTTVSTKRISIGGKHDSKRRCFDCFRVCGRSGLGGTIWGRYRGRRISGAMYVRSMSNM